MLSSSGFGDYKINGTLLQWLWWGGGSGRVGATLCDSSRHTPERWLDMDEHETSRAER